jgi:hypothetical protein
MKREQVNIFRMVIGRILTDPNPEVREIGWQMADWMNGRRYFGEDRLLDHALGLRQRGGVSPTRANLLLDRDRHLARLWKTSPDWCDLDPAAAARLMTLSAGRYETTRWPRERDALSAPSAEPAATWWRIMRSGAPIPSAERVAQILREIQ